MLTIIKDVQDSIFICETSLSLLLPINCNDDQSYACQLSTIFNHHTLSMWSHYFHYQYELFDSFYSFSSNHPRSWQNNQALDSTLSFIIYSSRPRLHRGIIKQNSKLDHVINFILLDQDTTNRIELRKTVKIGVWWWYDTGHLPQAWQLPRGVPIPMW